MTMFVVCVINSTNSWVSDVTYQDMYEAALNAQLVSLKARLRVASRWTDPNNHCRFEAEMVSAQVRAIEVELHNLRK